MPRQARKHAVLTHKRVRGVILHILTKDELHATSKCTHCHIIRLRGKTATTAARQNHIFYVGKIKYYYTSEERLALHSSEKSIAASSLEDIEIKVSLYDFNRAESLPVIILIACWCW